MMDFVWVLLMGLSIVFGILNGRMAEVSNAVLGGAADAVQLVITLAGAICLWNGVMKIADKAGLTQKLARLMSPIMRLLFPDVQKDSPAAKAICANVAANLMGLGNAATPLGLKAMQELEKQSPLVGTASNSMVMFVVLNTASLQLIPTTIAMLRAKNGSLTPMDILPAILMSTLVSLTAGIIVAKLLGGREKRRA